MDARFGRSSIRLRIHLLLIVGVNAVLAPQPDLLPRDLAVEKEPDGQAVKRAPQPSHHSTPAKNKSDGGPPHKRCAPAAGPHQAGAETELTIH